MTRDVRLDPGFDPRIAEWLEGDPDDAPDQVLETVLAALPSIPQRRSSWLPWRPTTMNRFLLAGVAAATIVAVGFGVSFLAPSRPPVGVDPTATPPPSSRPTLTPVPVSDYSALPGRILAEHLGNAFDGSDPPTDEFNPDIRRFYLLDPATMTYDTAEEFLPGQPATGKFAADVSADGTKVVFQDWAARPRLYEANLDGTGFRQLPIDCDCQLLYPDYDPSATRIVYTRIEGDASWLEIYDLGSGEVTPLEATRGVAADAVPEQPAWSPDGTRIVYSRLVWDGRNDPIVGTVRYGDLAPIGGVLQLLELETNEVTDLLRPPRGLPGDADWSPDGRSVVYSHGPASTTGSTGNMPQPEVRSIDVGGGDYRRLPGWGGPRYTPDGSRILVQDDVFYLMNPDGTDYRPVNSAAADLSTQPAGFIYIGHWIDPAE